MMIDGICIFGFARAAGVAACECFECGKRDIEEVDGNFDFYKCFNGWHMVLSDPMFPRAKKLDSGGTLVDNIIPSAGGYMILYCPRCAEKEGLI